MARTSWLDENAEVPNLEAQVAKLDHFTAALADGLVDDEELARQQEIVVEAMKAVELELSDDQHAKVTRLLVEVSAYNIMSTLHEMTAGRARRDE
jgi:hypothetical protein